MKTIIAGSREITDYNIVLNAIENSKFIITEIVSGNARGVDLLGERFAKENNLKVKLFPVTSIDWRVHGKRAGMLRNEKMALYGNALIAIWDGKSPGTKGMIDLARKHGLKVYVYDISKPNDILDNIISIIN